MIEKTLRTIIVDDDPKAIEGLEKLLANIPEIEVIDTENDPVKALGKIIIQKPDLLFTDIQMPVKSGFELISELFQCGIKPEIIFVTGYDKYSIKAIRFSAFDYLLKPVNPEELTAAIKRLLGKQEVKLKDERFNLLLDQTIRRPKIKFNTTGGFIMIRPEDIIYIQADWNYAEVFFDSDESETITMNIGSIEEVLPRNDFFRISRSVIINTNYLSRVNRKKMVAILKKDEKEFSFRIPILKLRKLESFLTP
jgi:two-component system, LytTR family, response regulator